MLKKIHGHEVMNMIIDSGKKFTNKSLKNAIIENFGADTRFYTCSADNMNAEELIDFLDQRGKFLHDGPEFTTDKTKVCDH
ncbi:MAG: YecH family protein [Chlamydiota bacterium]|nr:YecH family protein [Chlamydiota bacterium]